MWHPKQRQYIPLMVVNTAYYTQVMSDKNCSSDLDYMASPSWLLKQQRQTLLQMAGLFFVNNIHFAILCCSVQQTVQFYRRYNKVGRKTIATIITVLVGTTYYSVVFI